MNSGRFHAAPVSGGAKVFSREPQEFLEFGLVFGFVSECVGLGRGNGTDVGINEGEFVDMDRNIPRTVDEIVGVFLTISIHQLVSF